jgi:hypothetical protein
VTYFYSAYGLNLSSDLAIPGLRTLSPVSHADLQVWLGSKPLWASELEQARQEFFYESPLQDEHGEPSLRIWNLPDKGYFRLVYCDGTQFILDHPAQRVWATWPHPPLTLEDTVVYLLGSVFGFILRLRGFTCLHASAVAIGGRALAFTGSPEAGKSTTAAAFARRGHAVLSDDIVTLRRTGDTFMAGPGYPRVCLWPDSVNLICGSAGALPRLTPTWEKCYLTLDGNGEHFQEKPLPLAAIYVLGDREGSSARPRIETLRPASALIALVANTYMNYLPDRAMRQKEFDFLAALAARVPVRWITPDPDPAQIDRLCDTILEDAQSITEAVIS